MSLNVLSKFRRNSGRSRPSGWLPRRFIAGMRVGTGLLIARLPDGSWSAPCAVGSMGFTFGAVVGAEVTDVVTAAGGPSGIETYRVLQEADASICGVLSPAQKAANPVFVSPSRPRAGRRRLNRGARGRADDQAVHGRRGVRRAGAAGPDGRRRGGRGDGRVFRDGDVVRRPRGLRSVFREDVRLTLRKSSTAVF